MGGAALVSSLKYEHAFPVFLLLITLYQFLYFLELSEQSQYRKNYSKKFDRNYCLILVDKIIFVKLFKLAKCTATKIIYKKLYHRFSTNKKHRNFRFHSSSSFPVTEE